MEIKMHMATRDGKAYAEGIYRDGIIIVKAGGKISELFKGGKTAKKYREDRNIVDENGNILVDCEFNSPSTAAQFVNGNISNGHRVWKVDNETLDAYLTRNGLK